MRDTVLGLKSRLMERFSGDVKRLVSHALHDEKLLRQIVLEVVGRARDSAKITDDETLDVILPQEVVGLDALRHQPQDVAAGTLTDFVLGLTSEMMREGVSFSASEDAATGIRVRLVDHDVTLDLTDEAVAALLLQHLQPRFRAILEGVIR
jgi:V/A-type H+-transporting ATPase subunit E